jgi:hypothetical protein
MGGQHVVEPFFIMKIGENFVVLLNSKEVS